MKPAPKKTTTTTAAKTTTTTTHAKPATKAQPQKAAPQKQAQPQHQQQQQPQPQPKQEQAQPEPLVKISKTIKLPLLIGAMESDKKEDKTSFIIDTTGNAYTFFKYKGRLIDVSEMILKESIQGGDHAENVEAGRLQFVHGLKTGDSLVLSLDLKTTNLSEFFKSKWFQPNVIFTYSKLFNKEYYKKDLIKEEEDVDYNGNHGWYEPKKDQFQLVLLITDKEKVVEPKEMLKTLGLFEQRDSFIITQIIE